MEAASKNKLTAAPLGRFSREEALLLGRTVFDRSHLTRNQLVRIAEWLSDMKRIRKATLAEILREESLQKILHHPLMDRKAKGERFFETVRSLRFPRVSEAIKGSRDESFL
jgi:hypothetical protein